MRKTLLFIVLILTACENLPTPYAPAQDEQSQPTISTYSQEVMVYQDSVVRLFLAERLFTDITISDIPDSATLAPWRIPTKNEAEYLHTLDMKQYKQRMLCVGTDGYYTFQFGNQGTISRAGTKTKYCIRPVRTIYQPNDTIIQL